MNRASYELGVVGFFDNYAYTDPPLGACKLSWQLGWIDAFRGDYFYLKMKCVLEGAKPFEPGREEDAGWDMYSMQNHILPPFTSVVCETGIATEFPARFVGLVLDRSGLGWKGVMRQAGVIDSGFRDTWKVKLYNSGRDVIHIQSVLTNPNAKAIAQAIFVKREKCHPIMVEELSSSDRGLKGFGSTDK